MRQLNHTMKNNEKCLIAPSLLEADGSCFGTQIREIEMAGADYVHIDVMDGQFVPNLSFGMKLIESIRKCTNLPFDVHMMVCEPVRFVEQMKIAGADILTVHYEACRDIMGTLRTIRAYGMCAGLVLKPETPVTVIGSDILNLVDVVQLMTVQPGLAGQEFIPESCSKITALKKIMEKKGAVRPIEVDGGIHAGNIREVVMAGAQIVVSGKALFQGDLRGNLRKLKRIADGSA